MAPPPPEVGSMDIDDEALDDEDPTAAGMGNDEDPETVAADAKLEMEHMELFRDPMDEGEGVEGGVANTRPVPLPVDAPPTPSFPSSMSWSLTSGKMSGLAVTSANLCITSSI